MPCIALPRGLYFRSSTSKDGTPVTTTMPIYAKVNKPKKSSGPAAPAQPEAKPNISPEGITYTEISFDDDDVR